LNSAVLCFVAGIIQRLVFKADQALTTHYTGYDAFGIALHYLQQALQTRFSRNIGKGVRMVHAADIKPLCRKVLAAFPPEMQYEHVFGDMLQRLPAEMLSSS
jgi:hypothetical protein